MITRICDNEGEPEVGTTYLVPSVFDATYGWRPVIGPAHEDKDIIGVPGEHYHYDARFLTDEQLSEMSFEPKRIRPELSIEEALVVIQWVTRIKGEVVERPLVCLRRMPTFMVRFARTKRRIHWMPRLEDAFEGARLACLRCPHKGLPLGGLPLEDGRLVVCPGTASGGTSRPVNW